MSKAQDTFLQEMRERFRYADESEKDIRKEAAEDLRFLAGEQWDQEVLQAREKSGRPALTFNKLPTFVAQIANEARRNKPSIKFSAVDAASDPDTAQVYTGLARHIQYDSDADVAYETALQYAAAAGFGYCRLLTDYCDEESFNQDIQIETVPDPMSVYGVLVPSIFNEEPEYAFVKTKMPRSEYERLYPDATEPSLMLDSEYSKDWVSDQEVYIAEYWYVEKTRKTLYQLEDGTITDTLPEGVEPKSEREVYARNVKWCKTNGFDILEETDWAGKTIPIVAVLGRTLVVDGKPQAFSLIRFARGPQKLYNIYKTGIAEQIQMMSKAPWLVAEGQTEDYEKMWDTSHVFNRSRLVYKPTSASGQPVPPPIRNLWEAPIQALSQGSAQESDDIKATTGIFDASLGARGNETSGVAIQSRQRESDTSNAHFMDNLVRAQRKIGRIIAELIPFVYDSDRMLRIIGEDEAEKIIRVNAPGHTDLTVGKYDVTVTSGPSYTTRRLEAFDMLTQFANSYPALLQIAGDIIFRNSDVPGADQVAERFKALLPPQVQSAEQKQQIDPAMVQQLMAQHQQLTQTVQQLSGVIEEKKVEEAAKQQIELQKLDLQWKIAQLNSQTALAKQDMTLGSAEARTAAQIAEKRLEAAMAHGHEAGMAAADRTHEAAMTQAQHEHDESMAERQAENEPPEQGNEE